jgi:hypothetical protein
MTFDQQRFRSVRPLFVLGVTLTLIGSILTLQHVRYDYLIGGVIQIGAALLIFGTIIASLRWKRA